jgi:uncharacterized coiled-coil protein SlyX
MRRATLALATALTLGIVGDHAILAQNAADRCPPRFRRDPVATDRAREAKKAEMRRRGFPERLIRLLDKEECVACIEMASASFHVTIVYNDDEHAPRSTRGGRISQRGFEWDPQSERWARQELAAGRIKAFYILNTSTRCQCCPDGDRTNASYADWNEELELHMQHVIRFEDPRDLGPLPPDLENPPRGWLTRVPSIQQYDKPQRRVVQVLCRACQPIADRWNSAAGTLDSLWNRKINLLEGISVTRNAIGNRRNEIARLEYQQLFDATESADNQRKIEELKKVNDDQQAGIDRDERRIAELDRSIAEQQQRMDAIMKELLACEEKCKTTTATSTTPPPMTTGNPPPVVTKPTADQTPEPGGQTPAPDQRPVTAPANTPAAMCPDCEAAAAEAARINAQIQERNAELNRLRQIQSGNTANINNLVQLRADAAAAGDQATVAQYEQRISDLQAANKANREQQFKVQEAIESLNEALARAGRNVDACNRQCGATTAGLPTGDPTGGVRTGGGGRVDRTVAVNPLTATAACKECEPLLERLRAAHQELQRRAQRANDLQLDFGEFEEQRVEVERLQRELDACNRKCTTTTTTTTTALNTAAPPSIAAGPPPGTTGTAPATPTTAAADPAPGAKCPACQALADRLVALRQEFAQYAAQEDNARLMLGVLVSELEEIRAELSRLRTRITARGRPESEEVLRKLEEDFRNNALAESAASARHVAYLNDISRLVEQQRATRVSIDDAMVQLVACNTRCTTAASDPPIGCAGGACGETWRSCSETNTCPPIDDDCGVPGTCTAGNSPAGSPPVVDLTDPSAWGDTIRIEIELRIQKKGTDVFDPADFPQWQEPVSQATTPAEPAIVIPPVQQQDVRRWFNPLGLLTRRVADQIERWRGSAGPRPLLNPRDLALVGSYSSGQSLGLPKGVHVLLTDRGGSTGKTLAMQILNLSGKPVRLAAKPFAVEAIKQQAQQQIRQAFNRLAKAAPIRLDLAAYCLEFLKAPPSPNQILRLAPPAVQRDFAPISKVIRSAYRVKQAGQLRPDSNPAAYADAIKQWSVWAVEQKLNQQRFTEAFLGHTKKNVEAAGQQWSKPAEDMIRKVSPNRWRDIARILQGAGLPVPQ